MRFQIILIVNIKNHVITHIEKLVGLERISVDDALDTRTFSFIYDAVLMKFHLNELYF